MWNPFFAVHYLLFWTLNRNVHRKSFTPAFLWFEGDRNYAVFTTTTSFYPKTYRARFAKSTITRLRFAKPTISSSGYDFNIPYLEHEISIGRQRNEWLARNSAFVFSPKTIVFGPCDPQTMWTARKTRAVRRQRTSSSREGAKTFRTLNSFCRPLRPPFGRGPPVHVARGQASRRVAASKVINALSICFALRLGPSAIHTPAVRAGLPRVFHPRNAKPPYPGAYIIYYCRRPKRLWSAVVGYEPGGNRMRAVSV